MKIFNALFLIVFIGFLSISTGQVNQAPTAKSFFIPAPQSFYVDPRKAKFYTFFEKKPASRELTREIRYFNNGDGSFDIENCTFFRGELTVKIEYKVKCSQSQVDQISSITTYNQELTDETRNTDNEDLFKTRKEGRKILLKIPVQGKTEKWSIPQDNKLDTMYHTSSWTTVTINGETKAAIKVISKLKSKTVPHYMSAKYYVQDMGLWNTELIDESGESKTMEVFEGLSNVKKYKL